MLHLSHFLVVNSFKKKTVQFYKICVCTLVTQNAYFIDLYFIW